MGGEVGGVLAIVAGEGGFTLAPAAARKAATVLAQADGDHGSGNARLAARLLAQATASQARRVTTASQSRGPAVLGTIRAADIPAHIHPHDPPADDEMARPEPVAATPRQGRLGPPPRRPPSPRPGCRACPAL